MLAIDVFANWNLLTAVRECCVSFFPFVFFSAGSICVKVFGLLNGATALFWSLQQPDAQPAALQPCMIPARQGYLFKPTVVLAPFPLRKLGLCEL